MLDLGFPERTRRWELKKGVLLEEYFCLPGGARDEGSGKGVHTHPETIVLERASEVLKFPDT